jgi:hypothetical protein
MKASIHEIDSLHENKRYKEQGLRGSVSFMRAITRRSYVQECLFGGGAILSGRLAISLQAAPNDVSPITAETIFGKVRGGSVRGVSIFRGIPYGGPTEAAGRFLPPSKPAKWAGVRSATENGVRCVQGPDNIFTHPIIGEYCGGGRPDRVELSGKPTAKIAWF